MLTKRLAAPVLCLLLICASSCTDDIKWQNKFKGISLGNPMEIVVTSKGKIFGSLRKAKGIPRAGGSKGPLECGIQKETLGNS